MRKFREKFRQMLHMGDPPPRVAMAFAIGVFIAFSPFVGVHLPLAVLASWLFRLNLMVLLMGAFVNNPWTFVPITAFNLWVGLLIWPDAPHNVPVSKLSEIGIKAFVTQFEPYVLPFVVGSLVAGFCAAVIGYFVMKHVVVFYRRHRHPTPPG